MNGQDSYETARKVLSTATLGGRPAIAAGLSGVGLGLLASRFGPNIVFALARRSPIGPQMPAVTPEQMRMMRRRFGVLGLGAGMLPWMPLVHQLMQEQGPIGMVGRFQGEKPAAASKQAAVIDYQSSMRTIAQDPFLPSAAKAQLADIFNTARDRSEPAAASGLRGMLTMSDVIKGAVGAGLGHTGAVVAGSLLGSVFGLPPGLQKKLSTTGALAGALIGSGIISV